MERLDQAKVVCDDLLETFHEECFNDLKLKISSLLDPKGEIYDIEQNNAADKSDTIVEGQTDVAEESNNIFLVCFN